MSNNCANDFLKSIYKIMVGDGRKKRIYYEREGKLLCTRHIA